MSKRIDEGIPVEPSSGNVFTDLGLADARRRLGRLGRTTERGASAIPAMTLTACVRELMLTTHVPASSGGSARSPSSLRTPIAIR
jgi:hypothetical protein